MKAEVYDPNKIRVNTSNQEANDGKYGNNLCITKSITICYGQSLIWDESATLQYHASHSQHEEGMEGINFSIRWSPDKLSLYIDYCDYNQFPVLKYTDIFTVKDLLTNSGIKIKDSLEERKQSKVAKSRVSSGNTSHKNEEVTNKGSHHHRHCCKVEKIEEKKVIRGRSK